MSEQSRQPEPPRSPRSDFDVFAELYPSLRRFAAVVADSDVDPDDLVQDALAATLRRYDLSELHAPMAYLRQAILNGSSNHRRRQSRWRAAKAKLGADEAQPDVYPSDIDVLDVLNPIDRAVVYMADIEGSPHALIATELGLTPGAVRKRLMRSRSRLRNILGSPVSPITKDER